MIAYLDASVLLRHVLEQQPQLREWYELTVGLTSELARTECLRTVDRMYVDRAATKINVVDAQQRITTLFGRLEVLPLNSAVLSQASQPLPTSLKTLDAIHLATAHLYRATQPTDEPPIYFATFDLALAKAAHATGFRVLGATA